MNFAKEKIYNERKAMNKKTIHSLQQIFMTGNQKEKKELSIRHYINRNDHVSGK
jgi:hypothetical protein